MIRRERREDDMGETGLHRFSGDLGMVDGLFVPSKYEVAGGRLEFVYGLPKGLDSRCWPQTIATSHHQYHLL